VAGNGNDYTVAAVQKALRLLALFERENAMTLARVSELSGMGKSSVLRFLYTLRNEGFVNYDGDSRTYSLGLAVFKLGMLKYEAMDFRRAALPLLRRMSDETGLICYLAVNRENTLLMVEKVFPKSVPTWAQLMTQAGGTLPLYSTGIGRLFLAHMTDEQIDAYFDQIELRRFTPETVTSERKLRNLVMRARAEGTSFTLGENEPYIASICVPIYNHTGLMVAGISIAGVGEVICGPAHERYKGMILAAAAEISRQLGHEA
jgi:DNA-binding IclR family transcriptional regulator